MFDQWLKVYPDEADPYYGKPYYMFTFSKKTHDGYEITVDFEQSRFRNNENWKGYLTINDVGTHSSVLQGSDSVEKTQPTINIWSSVNSETKQKLIMLFLDD